MDLREWRKAKGLTVTQVAEALECSTSGLSALELGQVGISHELALLIETATEGAVTLSDQGSRWLRANRGKGIKVRQAGRIAARKIQQLVLAKERSTTDRTLFPDH